MNTNEIRERAWREHAKSVGISDELVSRHAFMAGWDTAAKAVERSFDHAYDAASDNALGDVGAFNYAYGEGYRHRDKQVRTVLEGFE